MIPLQCAIILSRLGLSWLRREVGREGEGGEEREREAKRERRKEICSQHSLSAANEMPLHPCARQETAEEGEEWGGESVRADQYVCVQVIQKMC